MDAQDAGYIKLSGPNPATSHSKALIVAVGLGFGDKASTRL